MAKRSQKKKVIVPAPLSGVALLTQQLTALVPDPRKRRFYTALTMALPNLTADDMDRLEPMLVTVIGRIILKHHSGE